MFTSLFRWFESRIDVFAPFDERETPPRGVWPFMWHHIKGVKGWMALIMLTGLGFSGIEAAMYLMVGWFVDLLATQSPADDLPRPWLAAGGARPSCSWWSGR